MRVQPACRVKKEYNEFFTLCNSRIIRVIRVLQDP